MLAAATQAQHELVVEAQDKDGAHFEEIAPDFKSDQGEEDIIPEIHKPNEQ